MYLTLSPKYEVDDNHKTNTTSFDFFSVNCNLMAAAASNLQRISKM